MGHGRAKNSALSPKKRTATAKCGLCGQVDSQHHCMLECMHHQFTAIHRAARISQALIAEKLMTKYPSACFKHFIQQVCHANWTDATHLERIWQGICCSPSRLNSLCRTDICTSTNIAFKLTAPLIDAYHRMLDINVKSQGCSHYAIAYAQTTLADSDQITYEPNIVPPLSPTATLLSPQLRVISEAMHVQ
jgi:hypothetical protein